LLLEYILFLLLGIAAGTACGLLPGLHVNNVGLIMLSLLAAMGLDPIGFAIFLVAMATTQSFIDFIPSIFLGVPDEETVLSLLPAHKLLIEGRGMEAVRITGLASLYGVIISLFLLPLALFLVPPAYAMVRGFVAPILLFAIFYLILRENGLERKLWAATSFSIAGYLGWTVLNIDALSTSQVFLPMFSGMFGISTLFLGLQNEEKTYPQDLEVGIEAPSKSMWRSSFLGSIGGFLVGLLPAMSPSQIGILLQEIKSLRKKTKKKLENTNTREFISIIASLNTADAMFSIFALYLMDNPRSGISVIIQDVFGRISPEVLALLCGTMAISGLVAYRMHVYIGRVFSGLVNKIDFSRISMFGIIFVLGMVFGVSGFLGLIIAGVSTMVGLVPALTGVSRTHCMGSLLLPTLLFFLGM
jgi:putative membrane protein